MQNAKFRMQNAKCKISKRRMQNSEQLSISKSRFKQPLSLPALKHVIPEIDVEKGIVLIDEKRLPEVAVCDWE